MRKLSDNLRACAYLRVIMEYWRPWLLRMFGRGFEQNEIKTARGQNTSPGELLGDPLFFFLKAEIKNVEAI